MSGSGGTSSSSSNLVAPNTSLGQHFLKNPAVVTAIVAKASIKSTDTVLEIGPGTGNMTVPLLRQSKNVIAIEYDHRMIREVLKRVEGTDDEHKLKVVQGDAIKTIDILDSTDELFAAQKANLDKWNAVLAK